MIDKKTLVLGVSLKAGRYSNLVVHKLLNKGHDVIAIGMVEGKIEDVVVTNDLIDYDAIDTITLYVSPKHQSMYYEYVIGLKPKRVIFNPGTENPEFYKRLKAHQIDFETACTLVLLSTNQY